MENQEEVNREDIEIIKSIVKNLNEIFSKNYFDSKPMRPFFGCFSKKGNWFVVCCDHYTNTDDKRFKVLKTILKNKWNSKVKFEFCFDTNIEVLCYSKMKVI
jgi:hypothetical protein